MLTPAQRSLLAEHDWLPNVATQGMGVRYRLGEDVVSAATEAMVGCAIRWDPDEGTPFRRYAWARCRGAAIDYARAESRVPRRDSDILGRVDAVGASVLSDADAAAATEYTEDQVRRARAARTRGVLPHLEHQVAARSDGATVTLGESLAVSIPDCADHLALMDAIDRLPARQAATIVGHDLCGLPLQPLADLWGVTDTRVSQIRRQAIDNLRAALTD